MAETLVFKSKATQGNVNSNGGYQSVASGNFAATFNPNNYFLVAGQGVVSNLPNAFYRIEIIVDFKRTSGNINNANVGVEAPGLVGSPVQAINARTGRMVQSLFLQVAGSIAPKFRFTPPDGASVTITNCDFSLFVIT